jgi:hypothetical protein
MDKESTIKIGPADERQEDFFLENKMLILILQLT